MTTETLPSLNTLAMFRATESDPAQEADVQDLCDQFLQDLEEEQWLAESEGRETIHRFIASAPQPADEFESWQHGAPFHCSFSATFNPLNPPMVE